MNKCVLCDGELFKIETLCRNLKILGNHFSTGDYNVGYCSKCGLVQSFGTFTAKDFLQYYTTDISTPFSYIKSKGVQETYDYFKHIAEEIEPYVSKQSRLLDIGGSWGELAEYLNKLGLGTTTVADPNAKCIDSMKKNGIKCVKADASSLETVLEDEKFDVIIMNHILEHIVDLDGTMKNAVRLLDDDGYVFIEVPDVEEYENKSSPPYFYLTYEHLIHFCKNDIINLANKYGFEICSMKKYFKEVSQYPCITVILKKGNISDELSFSDAGKKSMEKYLEECKSGIINLTQKYSYSNEPLILWGVGASTTQLLTGFNDCNVVQLIDINPLRQGLTYTVGKSNKPLVIQSPQECGKGKIVILSVPYEKSIRKYIADIGLPNIVDSLNE